MFTVILQSRAAEESYRNFSSLLTTAVQSGSVRLCKWIEAATTLETAVPELHDIVGRRKQWRAIVLETDPESEASQFPALEENPFDYLQYLKTPFDPFDETGKITFSNVPPMVRISQLLGGLPTSSADTYLDTTEEQAALRYADLRPEGTVVPTRRDLINEWNELHPAHMAGPSEIYLIKARKQTTYIRTHELQNWERLHETDSSSFWVRNGYAPSCRFMFFNLDSRSDTHRNSDLFHLWLSILHLIDNTISPSILQATRLYRIDTEINEEKLTRTIQRSVNELNYAQHKIEHRDPVDDNEKDGNGQEQQDDEENKIQLEKHIEVSLVDGLLPAMLQPRGRYDLAPEFLVHDFQKWDKYTRDTNKEWRNAIRAINRNIAGAADELKKACQYPTGNVPTLDEFDKADLVNQLDERYYTILANRESLSSSDYRIGDEIEDADREVERQIGLRTEKSSMLIASVLCILTALLSIAVAFLTNLKQTSKAGILYVMGATLLLMIIVIWIVMKVHNHHLMSAIRAYCDVYIRKLREIKASGKVFSEFFSNIVYRIRGKHYLSLMKKEQEEEEEKNALVRQQRGMLGHFRYMLHIWSEALELDIDFENKDATKSMIESHHRLDVESLYRLDISRNHTVEVNESGSYVSAPYEFVDRLIIEREEVFDYDKLADHIDLGNSHPDAAGTAAAE